MEEGKEREEELWKTRRKGRKDNGTWKRGGKEERGYWHMHVWDPDWYTER